MNALTILVGTALSLASGTGAQVSSGVESALRASLDDERHAQAFYNATMDRHGSHRPFSNIVRAEGVHEGLVLGLMKTYRLTVPPDTFKRQAGEAQSDWFLRLKVPATLQGALKAAYDAEVANVGLYDRLLKQELPSDVKKILEKLQADSKERHMPAFLRAYRRYGG